MKNKSKYQNQFESIKIIITDQNKDNVTAAEIFFLIMWIKRGNVKFFYFLSAFNFAGYGNNIWYHQVTNCHKEVFK